MGVPLYFIYCDIRKTRKDNFLVITEINENAPLSTNKVVFIKMFISVIICESTAQINFFEKKIPENIKMGSN